MLCNNQLHTSNTDTQNDESPEGWVLPQVRDILTINYGKGLKESSRNPGSVPVYGSNGQVGQHELAITKAPCIIVGRKGSIGAVHLSDVPCWPIDTTYYVDQFGELIPQFVEYAFIQLGLCQFDTSSAIPGLNRDDVYYLQFPLPPLAEQKRIVEKVQELLARVNESRNRLDRAPKIMNRFRQALLAAACSGKLTEDWREEHPDVEPAIELLKRIETHRSASVNGRVTRRFHVAPSRKGDDSEEETAEWDEIPELWTWCQADQIATICIGSTPSRKRSEYWNGNIKWVSSSEVANCRIINTRECITKMGLAHSSTKIYPKNTVLIAMIGEGKTRGQAAILDIEACTNQNVAGLVFDSGNVIPAYIWDWALSEYERNRSAGRGGAQPALNKQKVSGLWLPLPPFQEQMEIVRRVEALLKLADAIEKRVESAKIRADRLTQSILARVFRGELVPTEAELARQEGRDYEPASILLKRIAAQREEVKAKTKSKRARS